MPRTFIFDSADPDNSNFADDRSSSSEEAVDEDFLSFEDDLHTDDSSSDDSSSSSDRRTLSRFRSRTSIPGASDRNNSSSSSDDERSDGGGRPQKFVRALRAVKTGGANVVGRRRSLHAGGSSRRAGPRGSSGGAAAGPGLAGDSGATNNSSRDRAKRRKSRRKQPPVDQNANRNLDDVSEDEMSAAAVHITNQEEMIAIPFPGVLNVPNEGTNEVAFGDSVKIGETTGDQRSLAASQGSAGLRLRRPVTQRRSEDSAIGTGTDLKDSGMPTKPRRAPSTKRSLRRYSGSMGSAAAAQRRAGWEPGVDIRTTDIILQSIGSAVTIVDYSVTRYRIIQTEVYPAPKTDDSQEDPSLVVNKEFHEHLETRPSWSQVRWISVNGLSWEAISAISKRYQLHRLAIEDMVDIPQRTKVDLYPTHTFCCLPLHKLIPFKPQSKQDFNFWDWVLRKKKQPPPKKFSGSKLVPTKSNSSHKNGAADDEKNESNTSMSKEYSPPLQPPFINVPADGGRRRRRPMRSAALPRLKRAIPNSSSSSSSSSSDNEDDHKPLNTILAAKGMETIHDWNNPYSAIQHKSAYIEAKRPLAEYKRAVGVEQVSLFLTSQSTVISFFERSAVDIERPLLARLSTESTILRESCDPSLLLQAIVDAIVDLLQPIIAAYRRRMDELEVDAMINPSMSHTQDLHLMAGELSMLRNTIVPITSLVLSLRDHTSAPQHVEYHPGVGSGAVNDHRGPLSSTTGTTGQQQHQQHQHQQTQKPKVASHIKIPIISQGNPGTGTANDPTNAEVVAAVAAASTTPPWVATPIATSSPSGGTPGGGQKPGTQSQSPPPVDTIVGSRVSALAKVYLADISDHLLSHTQDLDVMRNNTKNMIDLIFNTISIQSSDSVGQLSLVTVIFLPLSFWTGYFGMNFVTFTDLDRPISFYWMVAIPFSVGVVTLAMLAWLKQTFFRSKNYVKKRVRKHHRKVKKQLRRQARRKEISHV